MMITLLLFKVIGFKGNRCQSIGNMSTTCFFVVPCLVKKTDFYDGSYHG